MAYTIAYCAPPAAGGIFSFYGELRKGLEPRGARVFALALGALGAELWDDRFAGGRCMLLAPEETDPLRIAMELAGWLEENHVDILMPICDRFALSAMPHLPERIAVVQRCCNITRHAYDLVANWPDRMDRIVAICKRQHDELRARSEAVRGRLAFIPHGIELAPYIEAGEARRSDPALLRLCFVNRLEHADKGCLYLAPLAAELERSGCPYSLDIAGSGSDRAKLEARLLAKAPDASVVFHGSLPRSDIPALYTRADVFLLTSWFEGCPWSLLEAMAAGAVPVVSRIPGVTDWIVRDGETGFVCPRGRMDRFADCIAFLHENRAAWATMSRAASEDVRRRFSSERFAADYHALLEDVLRHRSPRAPLPWSAFRIHPAFRRNWRRVVPQPLKNLARRIGAIA